MRKIPSSQKSVEDFFQEHPLNRIVTPRRKSFDDEGKMEIEDTNELRKIYAERITERIFSESVPADTPQDIVESTREELERAVLEVIKLPEDIAELPSELEKKLGYKFLNTAKRLFNAIQKEKVKLPPT
jgi:hypothetical protein